MKVEITEVIEIVGYCIGNNERSELLKHYRKYGDWNRLKDIMLKSIISKTSEINRLRMLLKRQTEELEKIRQLPLSLL